jgi:DNA-binding CsgD family transcriptional regulator
MREPRRDEETLLAIVGEIYQAALDASHWGDLLPCLTEYAGGRRGMLGITPRDDRVAVLSRHCGFDERHVQRWTDEFGMRDLWYEQHGPRPAGTVLARDPDLYARVRSIDIYLETYVPMKMDDFIVSVIAADAATMGFLSVWRSREEGGFSQRDLRTMQVLAPHLCRSAAIHERFGRLRDAGGESALRALPFGVIGLDRFARIAYANEAGERALRGGLSATDRRLGCRDASARSALHAAVARAIATSEQHGCDGGSLLRVPRDFPARPLQLLVAPVMRRAGELRFGFAGEVAALVIVTDPDATPTPTAEALRQLFALTPALSRLAAALAAGKTLAEHADEAQITVGTARTQLKELFARTSTSRQAELVRVLLTSVAALREPEGDAQGG